MAPQAPLPTMAELLAVGFRYKGRLALAFLLPILAGAGAPFLMTPKFEADSRVLVRPGREFLPQNEVASGAVQGSPAVTMKETIDTEIEILRSADLLRDVVQRVTPERLYPKLGRPDASSSVGKGPGSLEERASRGLADDLSVRAGKMTNVVEIGVRSPDRQTAMSTLAVVLDVFKERHIAAFKSSRSSELDQQLAENQENLVKVQRERADFATGHQLYSVPEQRSVVVQQQARDVQALRETLEKRAALNEQMRFLEDELGRQPETIAMQTTTQDSLLAEGSLARLRELKEKEQDLLTQLGPRSPQVAAIQASIASVRDSLAKTPAKNQSVAVGINPVVSQLRLQKASIGAELAPSAARVAALQGALEADQSALNTIARNEAELRNFDRRIADLEASSTTLRQRLTDARALDDLDRGRIASLAIIQQPTLSAWPVEPKKALYAAAGVVMGALGASLAFLLCFTFGRGFLSRDAVERLLGVPVLVLLPKHEPSLLRIAGPAGTKPAKDAAET